MSETAVQRHDLGKLALVLVGITLMQVAVLTLGDSRFGSGSDAGGRAAAVTAAVDNGGCDHDLGYWAAEFDPGGEFHPLTRTEPSGSAYVQPADILFVCGTAAASGALGAHFAFWLPVTGVVMAALGAWMVDRHSGGRGWPTAVIVGAVGPVAFYGSDLWEHAPATGAAVLGAAVLLTRSALWTGLLGGALWGLAVSFRLESAIVAVALGVVLVATTETCAKILRQKQRSLLFAAGGLAVLIVDRLLERRVFASAIRDDRVVGTGSGGGQIGQAVSDSGQRLRDVLVTNVGVLANDADLGAFLLGGLFVAAAVVLAFSITGSSVHRYLRAGASIYIALITVSIAVDPSFVPGMFIAAPLAALGVVVSIRRGSSGVAVVLGRAGLLALPVIWAFQWTGSLSAQWGGRYQLIVAAFLLVAAMSAVATGSDIVATGVLVGASVALGLAAAAWHIERTNDIAEVFDELAEIDCPGGVLLSTHEFLLREGGGTGAIQTQAFERCELLSSRLDQDRAGLDLIAEVGRTRATVLYRGHVDVPPDRLTPWLVEDTALIDAGPIPLTVVQVRLP